MSTRGFLGFVAGGTEKITYNHADSYPDGIGLTALRWLRTAVMDEDVLTRRVMALRLVQEGDAAPESEVERLRRYADENVGSRSSRDWYILLRETQGDPEGILAAGVAIDNADWPCDSLFCEWGYLIDCDAHALEVYRGFQDAPHSHGRFAHRPRRHHAVDRYWPVALRVTWPFSSLPSDDEFTAALKEPEEE